MNLIELDRALRQLRISGMATTLETRLLQAQTDAMALNWNGTSAAAPICSCSRVSERTTGFAGTYPWPDRSPSDPSRSPLGTLHLAASG